MNSSIFSFIKSYIPTDKKNPQEDYLTQLFAWMLQNIDGLGEDYCKFLLSKRTDSKFNTVENETLQIDTQVSVDNGRIDLVIKVGENGFICEHKVFSDLSDNQIEKYKRNSDLLGSGEFHTVLVTATKLQHTQNADISLLWADISNFLENRMERYNFEGQFVVGQFISYLKEQGLGPMDPINMSEILSCFPAQQLDKKLKTLFKELERIDWQLECPFLKNINPEHYDVTYQQRWGRMGIQFYKEWSPGIFAGVILDTTDHKLKPLDQLKGPDFVLLLELKYIKSKTEMTRKRDLILQSLEFQALKEELAKNRGDFEYIDKHEKSPWRILILRKSLFDILKGSNTKEDQVEALKSHIKTGLNLLNQNNRLCQFSAIVDL